MAQAHLRGDETKGLAEGTTEREQKPPTASPVIMTTALGGSFFRSGHDPGHAEKRQRNAGYLEARQCFTEKDPAETCRDRRHQRENEHRQRGPNQDVSTEQKVIAEGQPDDA